MEEFAQPILNGILLGGLYAIVAIGMSTMAGIVRVVNLAHGDLTILGSFLSLTLITILGVSPLVTLLIVVPAMYFVGYFIQGFLLNRVLGKEMEPPLLVAFGLSIILQNLLLLIYTPDAQSLMTILALKTITITDYLSIPVIYLLNFLISMAVILVLYYFFQNTYMGRAIRAASDDVAAAQLVGIDTKNIYAKAMGIAMMTAGVAGVLIGMTFTFYPYTGPQYLIIAFGVIVIGGMGSIKGTIVGGLILALSQLIGAQVFGPGYQLLCGYVVLLIVLAIRPQGIFGTV
ncbi:MAG: branched-chain amino acid ABC transporter permease [Deltaproteobacteria bacterium]|nr:branched-chain amino acid ABC transporter permease [Deltaproteobacteria bacterium]